MSTLAANPLEASFGWLDGAISTDAEHLRKSRRSAIEATHSVAWGRKLWELESAVHEALQPNWDGYGAEAVDPRAYWIARELLMTLPPAPSDPDIAVDPDGEVSITWRRGSSRAFSISVGGNGRISYAGLLAGESFHGTTYALDQVPTPVIDGLARLFPTGI